MGAITASGLKQTPLFLAIALASAPMMANAQGGERYLEEVVVNATKTDQMAKDVPVALTVLTADRIESAFTSSIENLQQAIPAVSFRKGNTTRNSALTVRGIGTISFSIAVEPSVSTVVDGVVLGRSGQAFGDLYELQWIELLRGPQGTLFGKNASAGVVNMITKRPSHEFEGFIELSMFQDNEYRVKTQVSGPLSDNISGSLTLFDAQFDGYIYNTYTNQKVNGYDHNGFRGMLEMDPSDDLNMLFIYEQYDAFDDCCADITAINSGRNVGPDSQTSGFVDSNGVAHIDLDMRTVEHDLITETLDKSTGMSFTINKEFDDGDYVLTSITAHRNWENTEFREGDFTARNGDPVVDVLGDQPYPDINNQPVNFGDVGFQLHDVGAQEWKQLSQELRMQYTGSDDYEWQAGVFFWNVNSERRFTRDASCQTTGDNTAIVDAANAADPTLGLTCYGSDIVSATAYMKTEIDNWAAFGEYKYYLSDELTLIAGLRYTSDEVSFYHNRVNEDPWGRRGVGVRQAALDTDFEGKTDETNVSGKVSLTWNYSAENMIYFTTSTGYKGPGFNVFYNMAEKDTLPISEETSDSFELGHKMSTGKLILDVVLFRSEIEGFQANNFDTSGATTITRLTNAGEVSTQGVEVDFTWLLTNDFKLYGGLAWVDAEIEKFNCPPEEAGCDVRSGLDIPFAPELKYTIGGEYISTDGDGNELIYTATYTHTDEQYSNLPGSGGTFAPQDLLPDYNMLNASVAYSFNDDKYRISLIAKNLLDESYVTTYSGDGFRYQIPRDAERYFGVQFRAGF